MAKTHVTMKVNGAEVEGLVEPRTLLVHFIRENLSLTGTHIGCETTHCGACTVDIDGMSVKSCTMFAVQAQGSDITTIEGVANADGSLSARPILINPPTDRAWRAHAESAMRAVKKCDPLHVPPQYAPYFDQWKVETIHFDPRESQG